MEEGVLMDRRVGVLIRGALVLLIFLVAVLHGDALHAPLPDRGSGLLHGQPGAHRIVHLAVQGGVQDALQAEVPVLFLQGDRQTSANWRFYQLAAVYFYFFLVC